jgi:hypothetical protein
MITQHLRQGKNEIKIESAESLDDAKKYNFQAGEYSRYYINNKRVENYHAMIQFIVEETRKNKEKFVYDDKELIKIRNEMIQNQNKERRKQLSELKQYYQKSGVSLEILKFMDDAINKIDVSGVRINE